MIVHFRYRKGYVQPKYMKRANKLPSHFDKANNYKLKKTTKRQHASIDNVAALAVTRSLAVSSSTPNHRFTNELFIFTGVRDYIIDSAEIVSSQ